MPGCNIFFLLPSFVREIDHSEDERERLEKEASSFRTQLSEALEERRRLQEENEQLKQLLKRETERLDAELAAKANVIAEYKEVAARLGEKLGRAQEQLRKDSSASSSSAAEMAAMVGRAGDEGEPMTNLDSANERIRELELELAQTKLALVETECKNQDLAHQFSSSQASQEQTSQGSRQDKIIIKKAQKRKCVMKWRVNSVQEHLAIQDLVLHQGDGQRACAQRPHPQQAIVVVVVASVVGPHEEVDVGGRAAKRGRFRTLREEIIYMYVVLT